MNDYFRLKILWFACKETEYVQKRKTKIASTAYKDVEKEMDNDIVSDLEKISEASLLGMMRRFSLSLKDNVNFDLGFQIYSGSNMKYKTRFCSCPFARSNKNWKGHFELMLLFRYNLVCDCNKFIDPHELIVHLESKKNVLFIG